MIPHRTRLNFRYFHSWPMDERNANGGSSLPAALSRLCRTHCQMPAFSLAFGSLGDFVTAIQLAIKLSDLLIRRRGARSSIWTETQFELDTLNRELELLKSRPMPDPLVSVGIQQELTRCDSDVQALVIFLKKTLDQGLWQKALWIVSEEKTLTTLKAKITGRRHSLTFLLGLMNSGALQAARARVDEVHREVGDANTGIVAVVHGVDEIGSQVRRGNATIDTIAHGVDGIVHGVGGITQGVNEIGSQVRHGNATIDTIAQGVDGIAHSVDGIEGHVNHASTQIRAQFETYQAQIVEVVTHLPRGVANDIFFVLSPTGVPIPISIVYCNTFKKLHRILEATLRDQRAAGARFVEQGSYAIVSSSGNIVSPARFNATIRGSVCLAISIAQPLVIDTQTQKCSYCRANCQIAMDGWYECENSNCRSKYLIFTPPEQITHDGLSIKFMQGQVFEDPADETKNFRRVHFTPLVSPLIRAYWQTM
ncbi:hypothetical protein C8R46DRAFT_1093864 [Mycena filopes]|nr:hypothetical protein C8R46DRAFT_1093864 [Mycena filopes]